MRTSTRIAYENRWMRVREDLVIHPDGTPGLFGVVEKPDFALIIPVDSDGGVWLVEQFGYAVQGRFWEFPQGMWEDRPDVDPATLAAAELREETGLVTGRLRPGVVQDATSLAAWTLLTSGPLAEALP